MRASWNTAMRPAGETSPGRSPSRPALAGNQTLLRVTWDAASEAELLFSILMGEDVEPRRRYIEEHALEVKNLDV